MIILHIVPFHLFTWLFLYYLYTVDLLVAILFSWKKSSQLLQHKTRSSIRVYLTRHIKYAKWFTQVSQYSFGELVLMLYSYLHVHSASQRHNIKDRCRNEGRMIKTHEGRHVKENAGSFFTTYLPLTLLQGFERLACKRMLETEHKLHILTPLLWPSHCVVLVLLMLGSTPSGLSEGPLGRVWPSLPHLVSTVWNSTGNSSGTQTQLS